MSAAPKQTEDLTLDPADWESFRELGHRMLDDMIDGLRDVRDRPAWQSPSEEARRALQRPTPREGRDLGEAYADFLRYIHPYPTGNIHPRFWGWVMGSGTPVGLLADLLAAAMNCHVSGYDQSAAVVEAQVIRWLADLMDYPDDASGLLVSGGTVANLVGVLVARNAILRGDVRQHGPGGHNPVIYASTETHSWLDRTCDHLGFGQSALRKIEVDAAHRINLPALRAAFDADRAAGRTPLAIVGNAGTVSCGATDDLHALADIAAEEDVWFHVDGAFGALAKLSPKYADLVQGLERADSVAFDLHKWGYMQYEVGAVLVRDMAKHKAAFDFAPSYLDKFEGGIAVNPTEFATRGIQLSRGFRALKVWLQLSVYGSNRIGALITQNIEHVAHLRRRVADEARLEQLGPSEMNVICFRFRDNRLTDAQLDRLNTQLLIRIQESGLAVPSNARVDGRFALRVAHTNHRSRIEDFDLLIEYLLENGAALVASMGAD